MSELTIRPATESDLSEMKALARRTINRRYRAFLGDENVDRYINDGTMDAEIIHNLEHCEVLLKEASIVGFTIYFDNIIHLMMVDPDLHRQGFGTILLEHAESQLFHQGNSIIRLVTYEENRQAMNFYKKNGWKTTKKEKGKNTGATRVFFEKFAS
jgi:ribosomal protein S18 acetylase RimI-like enzyme